MLFADLEAVYRKPLFRLLQEARAVHAAHWPDEEVQLCTLLSIKTGGCSEDCAYCAQSSRYATGVPSERLLDRETILEHARAARQNGASRFCMGAAWRGIRAGTTRFEEVLGIVREVSRLGLEVCVTLGQVGPEEARRLREAGVSAYNHNLDTSPEHYPNIVSTHSYDDRLATLRHAREAGMSLCCGGILGLGESVTDRLRLIEILSEFDPPPESVPINTLIPIPGTPLENSEPVDVFELVRMVATARIAMPESRIRLSAGRTFLSREAQALCLFAGANSIFYGDRLLTADNPSTRHDLELLDQLGLSASTGPSPAPLSNAVPAQAR
jgi:biotin synthase